jgi:lipid II:glycine glycyltransferase (peptidoglycan interpeptide bridge formation enzyme)
LGASDQEGYSLGAAYALHWSAINEFKQHHAGEVRWIDLGAGAGAKENGPDGLSRFKRGWATGEKVKYFCGSVCDWENYRLLAGTDQINSGYFPLYRACELS